MTYLDDNPAQKEYKSWQKSQDIDYPNIDDLNKHLNKLSSKAPLVASWEIEKLIASIKKANKNETFIFHAGACAERFNEATPDTIARILKIILQASETIEEESLVPVTKIARLAGQYGKPRSQSYEIKDGIKLPSWKGDLINGEEFNSKSRTAAPERLLEAHACAAITLNFLRTLVDGMHSDLKNPRNWLIEKNYSSLIRSNIESNEKNNTTNKDVYKNLEFYVSHEAFHLSYEKALTRRVPRRNGLWNLSTHMPWIGARTCDPNGSHIKFASLIENPVAVKISPMPENKLVSHIKEITKKLNPNSLPGKLVLIHRFGISNIKKLLPLLLQTSKDCCPEATIICDPMHGNTIIKKNGWKERNFELICEETKMAFEIHREYQCPLNGISLEVTGDPVLECLGGEFVSTEIQLTKSACDPRLNREQTIELSFLIANKLKEMQ